MHNALIEIGVEEMPARFVSMCLVDMTKHMESKLNQLGITTDASMITAYATPRRLTVLMSNLRAKQDNSTKLLYGPPLQLAKNELGEWQPAGIGFAKKCGVTVNEFQIIERENGTPIVAVEQLHIGQSTDALLNELVPKVIQEIKLPIAMKWGDNNGPFIRPIQWICAVLDSRPLNFSVFGVTASNHSYGHRHLSGHSTMGEKILITDPPSYQQQLQAHGVIVSIEARKQMISDAICGMTDAKIDDALLEEVTHMTEYPTVCEVPFDPHFLELPQEVLIECLKKHQKAFALKKGRDVLPSCAVVADSVTGKNKQTIIEGNQRVLTARLTDMKFFWEEDLKKNGFSDWNKSLGAVVFQDGLGSMEQKVERIVGICHAMCDQLNMSDDDRATVDRAAFRCKADLVSHLVGELPSLQGIMGRYYSLRFKEVPAVGIAIRDHYCPRFDGDRMPSNIHGAIIGIADRLDTMVACFENNAIPTGSRDPYGIRRSMIAIIRIILHYKIQLNLVGLIELATLTLNKAIGDHTQACIDFFIPRVESVCQSIGVDSDIIQSIRSQALLYPLHSISHAKQLTHLKQTNANAYAKLVQTVVRIHRISPTHDGGGRIDSSQFEHRIEKDAWQSFLALNNDKNQWITEENMHDFLRFCDVMSEYFNNVLVHCETVACRNNRLLFMSQINQFFQHMGNWIVLEK